MTSLERAALDERFNRGERKSLIAGYRELAETEANATLLRTLGICLDETNQPEDAKVAFKRALALDHSDTISKRRLLKLDMLQRKPTAAPPKPKKQKVMLPGMSHDAAKQFFVKVFPLGFEDPGYFELERDYKWAAHETWEKTLTRSVYESLQRAGNHGEVCIRLRHLLSKHGINLPSTFELIALNRLLSNADTQSFMSERVFELVYGEDFGNALDDVTLALQRLNPKGQAPWKWPILTLFPSIARPTEHMFVKPQATKEAAARVAFDLCYRTVPNSQTYARALQLGKSLLEDLSPLGARDFIDVHSFIWVTHSELYRLKA